LIADVADHVAPGVRRVTAPNPSALTGAGTQSYVVGSLDVVVVDPGPDDDTHLERLAGERVRYVLVTHDHDDHAAGARALADRCGALVLGPQGGQGRSPDGVLADGDVVAVPGWRLTVLSTPGHAARHLCFLLETDAGATSSARRLLFSGDLVLGGSSTVVAPPDGDMAQYVASLERLLALDPVVDVVAPGHGPLVVDGHAAIARQLEHRREREREVLAALACRDRATVAEIAGAVYPVVAPGLEDAIQLQVWAHLRKLVGDGSVATAEPDDRRGAYWLV
jgi:glyoxylase-like metal-dependent hydrolase (beta-lactamase superfamily II)